MFNKKEFMLDGYKAVLSIDSEVKEYDRDELFTYEMLLEVVVDGQWFTVSEVCQRKKLISKEVIISMFDECVKKFRDYFEKFNENKNIETYWNNLDLESLL